MDPRRGSTSSTPARVQKAGDGPRVRHNEPEPRHGDLRTARQQLKAWRDRYRDLFDEVPLGLVTLDEAGRIGEANLTICRLLRTARSRLFGQPFDGYVVPADKEKLRDHLRECMMGAARGICNLSLAVRGSDPIPVQLQSRLALDRDTRRPVCRISVIDLSERKRLERRIAELVTDERRRIGQELHDDLGQELTGLGYLAVQLSLQLESQGSVEAGAARELADGIQRSLDCARALARGLVSNAIAADGLGPALAELTFDVERRFGIRCRLECPRPVIAPDRHTATQMLRIIKEAVINAVKHSGAASIVIGLRTDPEGVVLWVRDDGKGIPRGSGQVEGVGLRIMRQRADAMGADLEVRSTEGKGTLASCRIPAEMGHETRQHEPDRSGEPPNPDRG